ncbi:MAG: DUF47 family protein [Syntrophomonas sp.]
MVFKIKPREEKFFTFFEELADAICEAAEILKEFSKKALYPEERLEALTAIEERGDKMLSRVMREINSSFIAPFDREDILLLARELNNILDHIQGSMEKFVLYKAEPPKEPLYVMKLIDVLAQASLEIKNAVDKLPEVKTMHDQIAISCEKIRSYEHEGDYLYRAGIALLFENRDNVIEIIKWKEIYEHLETTLDYCENVSNILKGITVKYV